MGASNKRWGVVAKQGTLLFLTLAPDDKTVWKLFEKAGHTREPGMMCVEVEVSQKTPIKRK